MSQEVRFSFNLNDLHVPKPVKGSGMTAAVDTLLVTDGTMPDPPELYILYYGKVMPVVIPPNTKVEIKFTEK